MQTFRATLPEGMARVAQRLCAKALLSSWSAFVPGASHCGASFSHRPASASSIFQLWHDPAFSHTGFKT